MIKNIVKALASLLPNKKAKELKAWTEKLRAERDRQMKAKGK